MVNDKHSLDFGIGELFAASKDMLVVIDRKTKTVLRVNVCLSALLGYKAGEMLGKSFFDFVHADDVATGQKAMASTSFDNLTMRSVSRSGFQIYLEWSGAAVSGNRTFLIARDATKRQQKQDELYKMAHYDVVTDLPNRNLFKDRVTQGLAQAKRENRQAAIVFIDLDNFKPVNDNYGHEVGDQVLRTVAQRLVVAVRETDTVARLGGDEFAVFLSMFKDHAIIGEVQKRLYEMLDIPIETTRGEVKVDGSCGIAIFPSDGVGMDTLLRCADGRMYKQKKIKKK